MNAGNASIELEVDGQTVTVVDHGGTLLDALREQLDVRSVKDGCSPQGQCGCCTVLVDGAPRVSCVTPLRRVAGKAITTVDGLADKDRWATACTDFGASQCGFCTPGIVVRLSALLAKSPDADRPEIERALLAHLCRCTGWQPIVDAAVAVRSATPPRQDRDLVAATARATLESHGPQAVSPAVTLGAGGFADDAPPSGALVAVLNDLGDWIVGETLAEARTAAGTVQGRRTTDTGGPPLDLPAGDWAVTLRTSWVEPAPLEVDASWCIPGGTPASPLANGGAFGAKVASEAPLVARRLADEHNRPVRVVLRREDMVRRGPKRPPVAGGVRADGTGILRVVRTAGISAAIAAVAPHLVIEEVDVAGPPTSTSIRAAGWAEALVLTRAVGDQTSPVIAPGGGTAQVSIEADGTVVVRVDAGEVLDAAVLDSYVVGAVHQALSWVTSEALTVAPDGLIGDLTIRSFGILRAVDMPAVRIEHVPSTRPAVAVGDAVFVATASAIWQRQGRPEVWPTTIASRSSD